MNETLDHTEPRQEGCRCQDTPLPLSLCPACFARMERAWAEVELQGWVPKLARPRLRLVGREG